MSEQAPPGPSASCLGYNSTPRASAYGKSQARTAYADVGRAKCTQRWPPRRLASSTVGIPCSASSTARSTNCQSPSTPSASKTANEHRHCSSRRYVPSVHRPSRWAARSGKVSGSTTRQYEPSRCCTAYCDQECTNSEAYTPTSSSGTPGMTIPPLHRPPQPERLATLRTPIESQQGDLLAGTAIRHHHHALPVNSLKMSQDLGPQRIATAMLYAHARQLTLSRLPHPPTCDLTQSAHTTTSPARQVVTACSITSMYATTSLPSLLGAYLGMICSTVVRCHCSM